MPDLPDFWGQRFINIIAQDLGEVINRPKYGSGNGVTSIKSCPGGATTPVVTIEGKGVLYGGWVFMDSLISHKKDGPSIHTDGNQISALNMEQKNDYNFNQPHQASWYLTRYDDVNFIYAFAFTPGITFETEWKLSYYNDTGSNVNIGYHIIYALV